MSERHPGGCLCGAVRFQIEGPLPAPINCHCQSCRRAHGAAFATSLPIASRRFEVLEGEASIHRYQQRYSCAVCGSRLFNRVETQPEIMVVMASALDAPPDTPPIMHLNLESKAPWYTVLDDAPGFPGFPPGFPGTPRDDAE